MNREIKKCPFCGGDAKLRAYGEVKTFFVECGKCGARTKEVKCLVWDCTEHTPPCEKAISSWNKRVIIT